MATLGLENFLYRKRNFVYAFVRHRLVVLCKQSVSDEYGYDFYCTEGKNVEFSCA